MGLPMASAYLLLLLFAVLWLLELVIKSWWLMEVSMQLI